MAYGREIAETGARMSVADLSVMISAFRQGMSGEAILASAKGAADPRLAHRHSEGQ
jgi:hypothetical protein